MLSAISRYGDAFRANKIFVGWDFPTSLQPESQGQGKVTEEFGC